MPEPRDLEKPMVLLPSTKAQKNGMAATRKEAERVLADPGKGDLDLSWLKFEAFDDLPEQENRIVRI